MNMCCKLKEHCVFSDCKTATPPPILIPSCPALSLRPPFPGSAPPPPPHLPDIHNLAPIHLSFIHQSDQQALTSKSLFTHRPVPWMSWPLLDVSSALPMGPTLCPEGMASSFNPRLHSLAKYSDAGPDSEKCHHHKKLLLLFSLLDQESAKNMENHMPNNM